MERKIITFPASDAEIENLRAGETVYISGTVYTGRDAAHKRMTAALERGGEMPFDFNGNVIFYAGPCPTPPGKVIGSIGPTTSGRMDAYSPALIEHGLKAMIGKGFRSNSVVEAIKRHKGVYFTAIGGAAALLSKCVRSVKVVAYEDLGTEAIHELTVEEMPVIVSIDCRGNQCAPLLAAACSDAIAQSTASVTQRHSNSSRGSAMSNS